MKAKHTLFIKLPLTLAVTTALLGQASWANTDDEVHVNLDTLVVTADRQGAKVKTNVITTQIKDESTGNNLSELLKEEPAIDFGGGTGTSQFYTIRGMGQNSIDLKIDNGYTDSQILYHQARFMLDPSLVKIVSVQKGAGSASAGIGQTNGAIVAKTLDAHDFLKGTDQDFGAKVHAGYATNNNHKYGINAFGRSGDFDALIAYNQIKESDYRPGGDYKNSYTGNNTLPYSALDKTGYLAKVGANFGDHRFVLSHMGEVHKGIRTVREEFSLETAESTGVIDRPLDDERQAPRYRETTLTNTNLEWTAHNVGNGVVGNASLGDLTANAYRQTNKRYSADDEKCGYCGNIKGPTTTLITTTGANLNLDTEAYDTLFKYGVNYRHQEVTPEKFLKPNLSNPEKKDIGIYVEAIKHIGDFTVTAGGRYHNFDLKAHDGKHAKGTFANAFSPSLGVIWEPVTGLSLSASHSQATRSPRIYDALMTHGNRGIVSVGDNLKAERAFNNEVGFNYQTGPFAIHGSVYHQHIKDAIANPQNRHGADGVKEAINAGYIKNKGYELGASYSADGLTAKVGVSHSQPRIHDTHPDYLLSNNPEFAVETGRTWTGSLAYRFSEPNLEIGVKNRSAESANSRDVRDAPLKGRYKNFTVMNREAYSVTDIFANWKPFDNDRMNVNFAVNNITNKLYRPHSQKADIANLPAAGRDFRIGVNYQF